MNYKESASKLNEFSNWCKKLNKPTTRLISDSSPYLDLGNGNRICEGAIITINNGGKISNISISQLSEMLNCQLINQQIK